MTDNQYTKKQAGLGRTTVETREAEAAPLTAEEERVVRMVHGLAEEDDFKLTFAQARDPEVNARLKMMEATLLAKMHGKGPMTQETVAPQVAELSPKDKILARLKKLEESH